MAEEIEVCFPASYQFLYLASGLAREVARRIQKQGADKSFSSDVELCVSEACTNAIKHGMIEESGAKISLKFSIHPNRLVIRVLDRGKGFSLDGIEAPELEKLPERGYGLFIIRSKMDHIKYDQRQDENILEMTRYFRKRPGEGEV